MEGFDVDPALAAQMGFSTFGNTKKRKSQADNAVVDAHPDAPHSKVSQQPSNAQSTQLTHRQRVAPQALPNQAQQPFYQPHPLSVAPQTQDSTPVPQHQSSSWQPPQDPSNWQTQPQQLNHGAYNKLPGPTASNPADGSNPFNLPAPPAWPPAPDAHQTSHNRRTSGSSAGIANFRNPNLTHPLPRPPKMHSMHSMHKEVHEEAIASFDQFPSGPREPSAEELSALEKGVRDIHGDIAYFLPGFVENPWENAG